MIVCAVYSLFGSVSTPCFDPEVIRKHTDTIFQRFDKLHQGYITVEDFMSFCLNVSKVLFFLIKKKENLFSTFRIRP